MADDSDRNRAFTAAAQTFASAMAELVIPKTWMNAIFAQPTPDDGDSGSDASSFSSASAFAAAVAKAFGGSKS
ncbi:hypothetical protein PV325_001107 [Microctonus aethiopoides]|nr:hypothetical protein PV325_001107 [Microctonus aethiopoides]